MSSFILATPIYVVLYQFSYYAFLSFVAIPYLLSQVLSFIFAWKLRKQGIGKLGMFLSLFCFFMGMACWILTGNEISSKKSVGYFGSKPKSDLARKEKSFKFSQISVLIAKFAIAQIGKTLSYDPAYVSLKYPGGDVPVSTGVCSDVVIRALRPLGMDLQKSVHEDMKAHFSAYPRIWGLKKTDKNIDHRRVPNLICFFKRLGVEIPITDSYIPGDIVVWKLSNGRYHTGIVSDVLVDGYSRFNIVHNIGVGAKLEDILFQYQIIHHFRLKKSVI